MPLRTRIILVFLVILSFFAISAYAANGDLNVQGNLSVGSGITFPDNTTQNSAAPGNALVWDYTVKGAPVTATPTAALNCDADGGYEFEFFVERGANGNVMVAFNEDTMPENYFGQCLEMYAATVRGSNNNQNTIMSFGSASDYIHGRGYILCPSSGIITLMGTFSMYQNGTNIMRLSQIRKLSPDPNNLTRFSVNGSNQNTIGVNSRFRIWKKK